MVVNACPMCLAGEETLDHLLLSCKVAQALWRSVLIRLFGCSWVLHRHHRELFKEWYLLPGSVKGRIMWRSSFLVIIWTIWREWNSRCFDNKHSDIGALCDKVKFLVAAWVIILPQFRGSSMDMITHNCKEVAFA